ncbi:MAG: DUF4363 family protein [Bacillota bacterium]|nr:DUF4363 family protein [Bacillota bacterium]
MRDLIISILCMVILIIPWTIYDNYSSKTIDTYKSSIQEQIIPAIEADDWDRAEKNFSQIEDDWKKYQKTSAFFIDTQSINEVDSIISKVHYYISLHDASNAAGEAAYLKNSFDLLHENESPSLGNIL